MKIALAWALAFCLVWGAVRSYDHWRQIRRPIDPALAPGAICDEVASKHEGKPTVGWYHACIDYVGEVQAKL